MFEQCIVAAKCLANTLFKYLYETACKKGRERERERERKREKAMTDIEVLRALTSKRVGNMKKHMKEN